MKDAILTTGAGASWVIGWLNDLNVILQTVSFIVAIIASGIVIWNQFHKKDKG